MVKDYEKIGKECFQGLGNGRKERDYWGGEGKKEKELTMLGILW